MKKVASLVLVLALSLALVGSEKQYYGENGGTNFAQNAGTLTGSVRSQKLQIEEGLKSLVTIVSEYKSQIDTKVRLPELQTAIDVIDTAMLRHQGLAKKNLDQLRTRFSNARLSYQQCVDPIFEWCVSSEPTFSNFFQHVNSTDINESDRKILLNMLATSLMSGLKSGYSSLSQLSDFEKQAFVVTNLLGQMNTDLANDFNEQKTKLNARPLRFKRNTGLIDAITSIFVTIVEFLTHPSTKSFLGLFTTNHLRYIKGTTTPSKEKQIEIITEFFNIMTNKLGNARNIAHNVKVGLDAEQPKLAAVISLENNIVSLMANEEVYRDLDPILKNLNNVCTEYSDLRGNNRPIHSTEKHPTSPSPTKEPQEPLGPGPAQGQDQYQKLYDLEKNKTEIVRSQLEELIRKNNDLNKKCQRSNFGSSSPKRGQYRQTELQEKGVQENHNGGQNPYQILYEKQKKINDDDTLLLDEQAKINKDLKAQC
ncbi:hypothetical protein KR074_004171 [Drosophila pseudoananassae]|nr:hypothetical protein KR074_004171 [Drosophila pseudoananassae]